MWSSLIYVNPRKNPTTRFTYPHPNDHSRKRKLTSVCSMGNEPKKCKSNSDTVKRRSVKRKLDQNHSVVIKAKMVTNESVSAVGALTKPYSTADDVQIH